MYSNKRLCLRSDTQNKSSFGERICDDLSEVILKFLPFNDKLRLECVSKQFQRTIFEKEHQILLDDLIINEHVDLIALESVLKKCPQINSIISNQLNVSLNEQMIGLIDKYCNKLVEIDSHLIRNAETVGRIVHKFDSKSFTLNLKDTNCRQIPNSLTHIKELRINSVFYSSVNTLIGFKNLKRGTVGVSHKDIQCLGTFLEKNRKLKCLEINFCGLYQNSINNSLKQISKLKDLIHLKIWTEFGINESQLKEGITEIALNCQQLKSFGFIYYRFSKFSRNYSKINEFITPFKSLKRLYVKFPEEYPFDCFSFQSFKRLEYLTHLTLDFKSQSNTTNTFSNDLIFKNIDRYLPNLQYLDIHNTIEGSSSLAYMLSGLTKLHTIRLNLLKDYYMDEESYHYCSGHPIPISIKDQIINKCKNIRFIKFY